MFIDHILIYKMQKSSHNVYNRYNSGKYFSDGDSLMQIDWNKNPLIPAIAQDFETSEVLMLAYMNEEAINKTIQTKEAYYFSRSRQELWKKGETSGNTQVVKSLSYDCDQDTILIKVKQINRYW